jgi:hypothetical protein
LCRRIVTGSLHGLVIADAYGLISAWVLHRTAYGGMFKFFDYRALLDACPFLRRVPDVGASSVEPRGHDVDPTAVTSSA